MGNDTMITCSVRLISYFFVLTLRRLASAVNDGRGMVVVVERSGGLELVLVVCPRLRLRSLTVWSHVKFGSVVVSSGE
jgi:hypothetical protein